MNKYKIGELVSGYVTGIEKYGIFIYLDDEHSGLIHISEIKNSYVKNIHDYAKIGDLIQAKIIDIDKKGQLKLSIKDLNYHITGKNDNKIIETSTGFSTLSIMLNKWINDKINEITEKKPKKAKKS